MKRLSINIIKGQIYKIDLCSVLRENQFKKFNTENSDVFVTEFINLVNTKDSMNIEKIFNFNFNI